MDKLAKARTIAVKRLISQRNKIRFDIIKLMMSLYPVGCEIDFKRWNKKIYGTVLEHDGFYEKLRIRSHTGKKYWLEYYNLIQSWN